MIYFVKYSKPTESEVIKQFNNEFDAKKFIDEKRKEGYICGCFIAIPIADCHIGKPRYIAS